VAGLRVYDTNSTWFIEIKMNNLDLMKMKGYVPSNPGHASEIGWLMATPVGRRRGRGLRCGGGSNFDVVWFLSLWCTVFSED
jgi:hypothetical protein